GGMSWNALGLCAADCRLESVTIDPNNATTLYASMYLNQYPGYQRISKSTDDGATWQPIFDHPGGIDASFGLRVAVARNDSSLIYASTYYFGNIFRTTDGGGHWTQVYV